MTRITDLARSALDALRPDDPQRPAVLASLAVAQQQKAANIVAYLNSDRQRWSEEDERIVRQYLGLVTEEDE